MRIAYVISAYKQLEQIDRLVRRLRTRESAFYVHVDSKTPPAEHAVVEELSRRDPLVKLLPRHRCDWGGFGHVAATLEGISAALAQDEPFDFLVLLTAQDYPIKPVDRIASFFEAHRDSNFIGHVPVPYAGWANENGGLDRFRYRYFSRVGSMLRRRHGRLPLVRTRRFPRGLKPYGGSSYWCLNREAVAYVDRFVRANPDVVGFFRHVLIPDELFFQTVLLNSPLAASCVDDDLRYVDWSAQRSHPATLRLDDLPKLAASPQLFARKFDLRESAPVLDRIDSELLGLAAAAGPTR